VKVDVIQPIFASGEGKQLARLTLINIRDSLLAEKLATEAELDAILEDLTKFTDNAQTLMSLPRIFQLRGRREI
jgi:hypothetical protein